MEFVSFVLDSVNCQRELITLLTHFVRFNHIVKTSLILTLVITNIPCLLLAFHLSRITGPHWPPCSQQPRPQPQQHPLQWLLPPCPPLVPTAVAAPSTPRVNHHPVRRRIYPKAPWRDCKSYPARSGKELLPWRYSTAMRRQSSGRRQWRRR